jgi:hypothetical protein
MCDVRRIRNAKLCKAEKREDVRCVRGVAKASQSAHSAETISKTQP